MIASPPSLLIDVVFVFGLASCPRNGVFNMFMGYQWHLYAATLTLLTDEHALQMDGLHDPNDKP